MVKNLIKSMRIKHWVKNGLLFTGLIFDGQLFNIDSVIRVLIAFVLFSLSASCVYIINDLFDVDSDKNHPKKKNRPIASGTLGKSTAISFVSVVLLFVLTTAIFFSIPFFTILIGYILLNLTYSRWLKHIVIIDVLVLASFYLIRLAAGVSVIDVQYFSPWLYLTGTFLALFMGIGKRRTEYINITSSVETRKVLEDYNLEFLDQMLLIALTLTIITYSFYTFFAPSLPENYGAMLTIPFALFGVFRYLYLIKVKMMGEAPEEILFRDRSLQIAILLWGLLFVFLLYR